MSGDRADWSRRGFLKSGLGAAVGVAAAGVPVARADEPEVEPGVAGDEAPGAEQVEVSFELNGEGVEARVGPDETALALLRERLGLTGTKESCGRGACGACTIRVDDATVASCLLPASSLQGRRVTTIEGLGPGLHPVQRAFVAADALQCGFCTPGMVMEAVSFHERWVAQHSTGDPGDEAVVHALEGHLCRCGSYPRVVHAVRAACRGEHDGADPAPHRLEAREKVTGAATYTVDVRLDGLLHGAIARTPLASGSLLSLDLEPALAVPGVRGAVALMEPGSRVRFAGQEVAAVAAADRATAIRAAREVVAVYEKSPAAVLPEDARRDGAPALFPRPPRSLVPVDREVENHEAASPRPVNAAETPTLTVPWKGNVRGPLRIFSRGAGQAARRVEAAREHGSERLVQGRWTTATQSHAAMEPHATVARWQGDELTVWMSTQACSDMADDVASRWGLKRSKVRVLCEHVGGGFGAKCRVGLETAAAVELARTCGVPVSVALSRREELTVGGSRPQIETEVAMLTDEVGDLAALDVSSWNSAGPAIGHNVGVFYRLMYPGAPRRLRDFDVVSHAPPAEPFRAPGGPPSFWSLEQAVDAMALQIGEDPLALRRRWDPHPGRARLYERVSGLPLWTGRGPVAGSRGRFRRGVGLASACWFHFVQTRMHVRIDSSPAGFAMSCATQDMGNGARTAIAAAAAPVLGVPVEKLDVRVGDSSFVRGPVSSGSRTTTSIGPAAEDAARQMVDALAEEAADRWALVDPRPAPGGVDHAGGHLSWGEILAAAPPMTFVGRRVRDPAGWFLGQGGVYIGRVLSGSVTVTEVEVDTRLGRVRPLRVWAGLAVGRIYAPEIARGQVQGGVIQGLGYALHEERRLDRLTGQLLTGSMDDYRIPGLADVPPIEVHFDDRALDEVTGGGVGLGELCTVGVAASVGNAVHHATGWRPRALPIRLDRVLQGVTS
jgi:xanthine dehydrogenase YagR molybdenum-binding subunit